MKINNQHQQVLYYLINWHTPFSLKDVINDSMFIKMQTRLSEIEAEHGTLTKKTRIAFVNKFGRKSTYLKYECTDIDKAKRLMDKY